MRKNPIEFVNVIDDFLIQFQLSREQVNDINEIFPLNEKNLFHQYYDIKNRRIIFLQENAQAVVSEAKHYLINSKEKIPFERDKKMDSIALKIHQTIVSALEAKVHENIYENFEQDKQMRVLNHQDFVDQVQSIQTIIQDIVNNSNKLLIESQGEGSIAILVQLSEISSKKIVQKLFLDLDQPMRPNRRVLNDKNLQKVGI